jgi:hypothetical protein
LATLIHNVGARLESYIARNVLLLRLQSVT